MSRRALLRAVVVLSMALGVVLGMSLPASVRAQNDPSTSLDVDIKDALETCYQCHGVGGVSVIPTRPTIAGQKSEYIRRQLMAFKKTGPQNPPDRDNDADNDAQGDAISVRKDPVMEHMAADLPDRLIASLADAISQLACDGAANKGAAKKGGENPLARPPAAEACVVCHGADGIGVQNQVPNLAGQHRAYLRRQLLLIRETAWGAQPREGEAWRTHPIMEAKAARLKIADIDATARYYSTLDCRGAGAGVRK